jgi:hypothetical protein
MVVPGHDADAYFLSPGNVWAIHGNEVAQIEVSGQSIAPADLTPVVLRFSETLLPKLGRR